MTDPDRARLEQIREREQKATKGPWDHDGIAIRSEGKETFDWKIPSDSVDADFIAHAREDIPWLLYQLATTRAKGEAEARRERNEWMLDKLTKLTWLLSNEQYARAVKVTQDEIANTAGELQYELDAALRPEGKVRDE